MKTILVPYDFSEYAEAALDFAVQIRQKSGGIIHLVHVIEYPLGNTFNVTGEISSYDPMDKVFTLHLIDRAKTRLDDTIEKYPYDKKMITPSTLMGYPFDGIMDEIKTQESDLIVMGTKGATGLKEFFIGSNAEKIVRNAKCPVITIHKKTKLTDIKDIVFATDLTARKSDTLKEFQTYQKLFDAKIHLVWVETPQSEIVAAQANEILEQYAKSHHLENYKTEIIRDFSPDEGILNHAWQINADMIAMCTNSRKGLVHLFLGSIAEDVVNHSTIPVWTLTTSNKK